MADKIDQLKVGNTSYDIDLPPDAEPDIVGIMAKELRISTINASGVATLQCKLVYDETTKAVKFVFSS